MIGVKACVVIGDKTITSATKTTSLKNMIEKAVAEDWDTMGEANQAIFAYIYNTYNTGNFMDAWCDGQFGNKIKAL